MEQHTGDKLLSFMHQAIEFGQVASVQQQLPVLIVATAVPGQIIPVEFGFSVQ